MRLRPRTSVLRSAPTTRTAVGSANPERGSAIVVAVVVLFVIMSAVASTLSISRHGVARVNKGIEDAYVIAESGIDRALYEVQNGVDSGFFGVNSLSMSGGMADSHDSGAGSHAIQVGGGGYAGSNAFIGSNAGISLSGIPPVHGDVRPAPGFVVSGTTGGVTRSTAPEATPRVVAPYVYTPPILAGGAFSGTQTFTTGTYRFTTFTVPGGQTATFTGNVDLWVDGNFTISGSGQGILAPGAHLTIHQGTGNFTVSGGGIINQDQIPSNLTVLSATTSTVTVSGSAAFFGSVYAPLAPGVVSGSGGLFGACTAKTLNTSGGAGLHLDSQLGFGQGYQVNVEIPFKP